MQPTRRLFTALAIAVATAACQAAPTSPPAHPTAGTEATPTAVGSTVPSAPPSPTATLPPPATTGLAELVDGSKPGRLRVATTLTSDGQPVTSAPVSVSFTALDDTYQVITLKGIVPVPTKDLKVGFRFNQEGAGPAPIDMRIYRITYADGGRARNRVPNSNFESGLYYWAVYGSGTAKVVRSDVGGGRMLRLRATPDKDIAINSYSIRVTPGSDFTLRVTAKVPPSGKGTGYAAVFFLWGKDFTEGYRETVSLVAPPIATLALATDASGAIVIDKVLPAGRYKVTISYAGDATHAASSVEGTFEVG